MVSGSNRASGFRETEGSGQRLGAWAASEEEPKPMRGTRGSLACFPGAWRAKTLKPSL
jgi:hypothetical protein